MSGLFDPKDSRQASHGFSGHLFMAVASPFAPGNRRRWWTILAVVLALAILIPGGIWGYARHQDSQTIQTATEFCNDLQHANYDDAYNLLSSSLQGDFPRGGREQFMASLRQLELHVGTLKSCLPPPGGYHVSPLKDGTTRVELLMNWSSAGLQDGGIHVTQENGLWKVDEVEETLLTVGLGALALAIAYCDTVQGLDFGNAYLMLTPNAQRKVLGAPLSAPLPPPSVAQEEFARLGIFHYFLDGRITSCGLLGIPSKNTDTESAVVLIVKPTNLPSLTQKVTMSADKNGNNWMIDDILRPDPNDPVPSDPTTFLSGDPQGTDVQPLLIGEQLCDAVAAGTTGALTTFAQTTFSDPASVTPFINKLTSKNLASGCYPDLETYMVDRPDSLASFILAIKVTNTSSTPCVHVPLTLQKNQQGTWQVASADVKDCPAA